MDEQEKKTVTVYSMPQLIRIINSGTFGKCGLCGCTCNDDQDYAFVSTTGTCPCCHEPLRIVELKEEK